MMAQDAGLPRWISAGEGQGRDFSFGMFQSKDFHGFHDHLDGLKKHERSIRTIHL